MGAAAAVAHAQPWPYSTQTGYQAPPSYGYPQAGYPAYYPGNANAFPNYPRETGITPNVATMGQTLPAEDPSGTAPPPQPANAPTENAIENDEATPVEGSPERAGPRTRYWASVDYIMLFLQPGRTNTPLVTNGNVLDLHPGALDQQGTAIIFGDNLNYGMFSGIRPEIGFFIDPDQRVSLEWTGLFVIPRHISFTQSSDAAGNPVITRPIFNAVTQDERAFIDALPGTASGSIAVETKSEIFGTEVNSRYQFTPRDRLRIDGLLGFRYMRLAESLTIQDQLSPINSNLLTFQGVFVNAPNSLSDYDSFTTTNNFYGMQIGGRVIWEGNRFFGGFFGKLALGATDQRVDINGSTALLTPGGAQFASGGILALPTNIGQHGRTVVGFMPEAGVNVGVRITPNLHLMAGYSFLYWNKVVRPGNQIDRVISPNMVPTDASFGPAATPNPAKPGFSFDDESLWIQQVNVGVGIVF